jgi:hypothetical protein
MIARTGLPGQYCPDSTAKTEQPERDNQKSTAKTRYPGKDSEDRQPKKDCQEGIADEV